VATARIIADRAVRLKNHNDTAPRNLNNNNDDNNNNNNNNNNNSNNNNN
jgi:hypothetical protein